jgi:hypothetical protein
MGGISPEYYSTTNYSVEKGMVIIIIAFVFS